MALLSPSPVRRILPLLAVLLFVVAVFASAARAAAPAPTPVVQSTSVWKQNAAPAGWSSSLNRVVYNSMGSDGMFDAYSANPDGSDPLCLTCTSPTFPNVGANTNRGASDVSPDGKYMLVEIEGVPHAGQVGGEGTQPGKGEANNIWLERTDGSAEWQLTNGSASGDYSFGTMWARFDRTGNEIVWASMTAPPVGNLGSWELNVANITWTNGVPSLTDVRVIRPATNLFMEPYGFTPDDQHVIFATNDGQASWMDSQIDTIDVDGTGLTQLSHDGGADGFFTNYHEFAYYMPGENRIMYGSTVGAPDRALDFWTMAPDGSSPQRLTYFNFPWSSQELPGSSTVGGIAFDPSNPNHFITGLATDSSAQTINAESVTLDPSPAPGLTEQFFSGQGYTNPIASATTNGNPSVPFSIAGSPAAGVPSSQYSIRWIGTVTPPTSGTYQICSVAEYSDQVYVNQATIVNGSYSYGKQVCGSVALTAGVPAAIQMDLEHGTGSAFGQLTWVPPGSVTPVPINGDLMNAAPAGETVAGATVASSGATAAVTPTSSVATSPATQASNGTAARATTAAGAKAAKAKALKAKTSKGKASKSKASKSKASEGKGKAKSAAAKRAKAKAKAAQAKRGKGAHAKRSKHKD
jgi:PA14 domain